MATLEQKIAAERKARELLEKGGLAQPDSVEYGYTCIRLFFNEPKLCMIVQIDEPPEGWVFAEDMDEESRAALPVDPDPDDLGY
jgi:hypothetical protein